jgi:site-specific DNA-cytosine methylase
MGIEVEVVTGIDHTDYRYLTDSQDQAYDFMHKVLSLDPFTYVASFGPAFFVELSVPHPTMFYEDDFVRFVAEQRRAKPPMSEFMRELKRPPIPFGHFGDYRTGKTDSITDDMQPSEFSAALRDETYMRSPVTMPLDELAERLAELASTGAEGKAQALEILASGIVNIRDFQNVVKREYSEALDRYADKSINLPLDEDVAILEPLAKRHHIYDVLNDLIEEGLADGTLDGLSSFIRLPPPASLVERDFAGRVLRPMNLSYPPGGGAGGRYDVVSLFDGISAGRLAMHNANLPIGRYIASEIEGPAITISQSNWPGIEQVGDVTKIENPDAGDDNVRLPQQFDLLIGGSPCQDMRVGRKGLEGNKSKLFYEFLRIFEMNRHRYFIFENTDRMSVADRMAISDLLGTYPLHIPGGNTSGAARGRYFWTNIPDVHLPMDFGILYDDVLLPYDEAVALGERQVGQVTPRMIERAAEKPYADRQDKSQNRRDKTRQELYGFNPLVSGKAPTITRRLGSGSGLDMVMQDGDLRRLSVVEAERFMNFPDHYTAAGSRSSALHGVGNSFTVGVVEHILSSLSNEAAFFNGQPAAAVPMQIARMRPQVLDLLLTSPIDRLPAPEPAPIATPERPQGKHSLLGRTAGLFGDEKMRSFLVPDDLPPEYAEAIADLVKSGDPEQIAQAKEMSLMLGAPRLYLRGADLSGADLTDADLTNANLSGAVLLDAFVSNANLTNANLSGADLNYATLRGATLSNANLRGANLRGADLTNANLINANLSGSNLRNTPLRDVELLGADLSGANLSNADLRRINLRGANLRGADLRGVQIRMATLAEADLRGADLTDADLPTRMVGIIYDDTTVFPDDFTPPPKTPTCAGRGASSSWQWGQTLSRASSQS